MVVYVIQALNVLVWPGLVLALQWLNIPWVQESVELHGTEQVSLFQKEVEAEMNSLAICFTYSLDSMEGSI